MNNFKDSLKIQSRIIEWGKKNCRNFPWRETKNAYEILIAEFFLQRTPPHQVLKIYNEFIEKFPDFYSIYNAKQKEIDPFLHTLGLHKRKNTLKKLAEFIVKNLNGIIPCSRKELLTIPGIGSYTASIIRCSCFECPDPPLDTNTVRITGRFFNFKINDSSRRSKRFRKALYLLMDVDNPRLSAYSLIDLGIDICKTSNPRCNMCPLNIYCSYSRE